MKIRRSSSTPSPLPTIEEHNAYPPPVVHRSGQRVMVARRCGQVCIATCIVHRHRDGRESLYLRLTNGHIVAHASGELTIIRTL